MHSDVDLPVALMAWRRTPTAWSYCPWAIRAWPWACREVALPEAPDDAAPPEVPESPADPLVGVVLVEVDGAAGVLVAGVLVVAAGGDVAVVFVAAAAPFFLADAAGVERDAVWSGVPPDPPPMPRTTATTAAMTARTPSAIRAGARRRGESPVSRAAGSPSRRRGGIATVRTVRALSRGSPASSAATNAPAVGQRASGSLAIPRCRATSTRVGRSGSR